MIPNLRFPAEWEPQSAILLAWPNDATDWAARLGEVEETYVALVAAITRFEEAVVIVRDDDVEAYAEARLRSNRVDMQRVRFIQAPYNDTWLRDSGPVTLKRGHEFVLNDYLFTGWGGKFDAGDDDRIIANLESQALFKNATRVPIDFALEGGAIETDGAGTLLSTWNCLHERHPHASREQITARLCEDLHQHRVLWLDHGYLEGDDTDAHIDTLARFASPDSIVYQACDDQRDTHFVELTKMAEELAGLRTPAGTPYRLFALPWPQPILDEGRRLAASYANFLIVNGAVLMPGYGDPADARAVEVMRSAFPDREIVQIPARPLIWQNGSLHCLTMQLPHGLV